MNNPGARFFITVFLIFCHAKTNAQDNSGCLTKHQLFKMQSSSLEDVRMFLNNEDWSFDGAKSNQLYNYFDYPINYNIVNWEKSSYSNSGNIILYNSVGKPNIIIYQSNASCFNDLLKSMISKNGKTSVDENRLITIFKENNITIEFREYKNDYSSRKFSVLLYNSIGLNQEIKIFTTQDNAFKKSGSAPLKKNNNELVGLGNDQEVIHEEVITDKPFTEVDEMPQFPGGEQALFNYLCKKINYPAKEKDAGISGTVYIYYVINKEGKVTNAEVKRGIKGAPGLDKEALRVIQNMPTWSVGKKNGKPVLVEFTLPVKFVLK